MPLLWIVAPAPLVLSVLGEYIGVRSEGKLVMS